MNRVLAVVLATLCANAPALELSLTEPEKASCESEGGCLVVTRKLLKQLMEQSKAGCGREA